MEIKIYFVIEFHKGVKLTRYCSIFFSNKSLRSWKYGTPCNFRYFLCRSGYLFS